MSSLPQTFPNTAALFVRKEHLHLFGSLLRRPQDIYNAGNPYRYAFRRLGAGALEEWASWRRRAPCRGGGECRC